MGVGGQSGSDRLRTIWTPEMDHYFIDLMLEQVRKGSRIDDHLFTKRAWNNMASLFNAKFRFQYEKDVLKNRHKTLRNLYKAIKSLLHQKGFSWDETRQMVTADNQVWDEYIKVHPDARSYRIKTIPHYNDLCEIYKNAMTDGEGTTTASVAQSISVDETAVDALQDIMIDEDYAVSLPELSVDDIPQTASDTGARSGTRSRTYWQPPMDRYFIDLMLDHVQQGNQIDGLFHKHAWVEMLASFNAKFGFHYDVDILKNRYKTLRRQYNVITNLLELDGFIWDETRQMVTADDCVWQDYIKAHTNARQYMTRPVPYYKDLCKICGEINADGGESLSGNELCQQDEGLDVNIYQNLLSLIPSFSSEELVGEEESSRVANQTNRRRLENASNPSHSKKTKTKDEGVASALREMATAVSSLADKRKDDEDSIPIETVIEAIQTLPDMDEELVLDACDFLEDEKKAKTFLALDVKLRKKWLIRKLRPQEQ